MLQLSFATPADMALCRQMIRQGSKSFHLASLLLPARFREDARCLYGFCRMADDLVDQAVHPRAATDELARRLDGIYGGTPGDAATDRAFADVVHRFAIPRAVPDALIDGFVWDAVGKRYETLSDVTAYSVRVAGTVGIMMSLIMGTRDERALARAVDLGIAMQFSNIARDVVEDAGMGRVYLPDDLLQAAGVTREDVLRTPTKGAAVATQLVASAEAIYERSTSGIAQLPRNCRASINAARLLYREIGIEAVACKHAKRAVVSFQRKLALVASALLQAQSLRNTHSEPCVPEAAFLVAAVTETALAPNAYPGIDGQLGWVLDMFKTVEARKSRPETP
jgi:15-cis-phytoene synthase